MEKFYKTINENIYINLQVSPNASKNTIAGIRDNRLCVRITPPPEDGKANACLREFLAKTFNCAKRDVILVKGEKSRKKTVSIPSLYIEKVKVVENNYSTPSLIDKT
jgi:uncharacterized protein (TIGR00251 family)